ARLVKIQVEGGLPGVGSLKNRDVLVVDGSRIGPPLAECLLDPCGKRQRRLDLGALQISSGERKQRQRFLYCRYPTGTAVISCNSVRKSRMGDDRALSRSFGKNFHGNFRVVRVKSRICPLGCIAGEARQLWRSAERLDVFVENFVGGTSAATGTHL